MQCASETNSVQRYHGQIGTMRLLFALLVAPLLSLAQPWSIERLYTRPFVWGTAPGKLTWARQAPTLIFAWNADGRACMALYAYHARQRKLVRLTDFVNQKDELTAGEPERDPRLRAYLPPAEGIRDFDVARDGSRVVFSHQGDLYLVPTSGLEAPFRLTRTKAVESSPHFSPEGTRLAYARSGELFVQDLANGQLWQVTNIEGGRLSGWSWSPDGRWFVYLVRRGEGREALIPNYSGRFVKAHPFPRSVAGDEPQEVEAYVIGLDGRKPRLLDTGTLDKRVYLDMPQWSPDSSKLLLCITHPSMKRRQVLVISRDTGKAVVVHEEQDAKWVNHTWAGGAAESPQVLVTSERDGWSHL